MPDNFIDLDQLDGHQFEDLVEKLIQKIGFLTEERSRSADGGIDILAINQRPIIKGKYIIQCKRYSKTVGISILRDLYGVVHSRNANKGILITNSKFTKAAKDFSKDKQLELIDRDKLILLLSEHDLLTKKEGEYYISEGTRILQLSLFNPLKNLLKQVYDLKNGIIFLNKNQVKPEKWAEHTRQEIKRYVEYIDTMENIVNRLFPLTSSDDPDDIKQIHKYSKLIVNATKTLLDNYEGALKLIPPALYLSAHDAFLKIYEAIFESWKVVIQEFEKGLENPPSDGKIDLTLDVDKSSDAVSQFGRELDKLKAKKSGCFIVTAVYGTSISKEVNIFRNYRDKTLIESSIGRGLSIFIMI